MREVRVAGLDCADGRGIHFSFVPLPLYGPVAYLRK